MHPCDSGCQWPPYLQPDESWLPDLSSLPLQETHSLTAIDAQTPPLLPLSASFLHDLLDSPRSTIHVLVPQS